VYCLGIMILKHQEVLLRSNQKKSANKEDTEEGGSGKTVEAGLNKETTESILGSPEEINDVLEKTCFGLPVLCPMLAVGVGAAIVLLVALR